MKTYGQMMDEALHCDTREQADAWLEREADDMMREYPQQFTLDDAKKLIRINLGYMSGYYDMDVAQRVYELYDAEHPVFGTPAMRAKVTPEDAFAAGKLWAAKNKEADNDA